MPEWRFAAPSGILGVNPVISVYVLNVCLKYYCFRRVCIQQGIPQKKITLVVEFQTRVGEKHGFLIQLGKQQTAYQADQLERACFFNVQTTQQGLSTQYLSTGPENQCADTAKVLIWVTVSQQPLGSVGWCCTMCVLHSWVSVLGVLDPIVARREGALELPISPSWLHTQLLPLMLILGLCFSLPDANDSLNCFMKPYAFQDVAETQKDQEAESAVLLQISLVDSVGEAPRILATLNCWLVCPCPYYSLLISTQHTFQELREAQGALR